MVQKIFIIAGEASGDLHGSNLAKELKLIQPELTLQGWGGDLMEKQGVTILKHYKELAFMGFIEVIKNINTIRKNFSICKQQINEFKPDIVLFVDYPGFNLRLAKWVKQQGYKTVYYISPQIWAWKENRIHQIKKNIDQMLVILPFEQAFYNKWNYQVAYVGHPLAAHIQQYKQLNKPNDTNKKLIALLPGSRVQEIKIKLPIMISVAQYFPEYMFAIAKAPHIDSSLYQDLIANHNNVTIWENSTYDLLNVATAALVTSGTATLETALFKVPQVVCYKGNKLSYMIAKRLIKIKYISLVNLILDKHCVTELIQDALTTQNLKVELENLLDKNKSHMMQQDYIHLDNMLMADGDASKKAAQLIL
jgi:lipid-A-disaccharide synthase